MSEDTEENHEMKPRMQQRSWPTKRYRRPHAPDPPEHGMWCGKEKLSANHIKYGPGSLHPRTIQRASTPYPGNQDTDPGG